MPSICGETCGGQMRDPYTAYVDELHLLHVVSGIDVSVEASLKHASGVAR